MKKEIHLQFSGCSWNAFPIMCYVAFTTVVFVGNLARTCYRTFTATPMIAICKVNERKNKAFGRGGGAFSPMNGHKVPVFWCSKHWQNKSKYVV